MSFENKKFLDIIGISHLWGKIKEQFIDVDELNIIVEAIDEVKADKEALQNLSNSFDTLQNNFNTLNDKIENGDFNGEDGYTPVRGVDYWTEVDKTEIKSYVDEAILGGAW